MGKKESTAEALAHDLARLRGLHEELKSGITSIEREVALLEERDMECARRGFRGEDVRKERGKIQETLAAKRAALDVARRDLGILEAELARVEVDHTAAQRQADEEMVARLIREIDAEAATLAAEFREAAAALGARLQGTEVKHQHVLEIWEDLGRGEYLGSRLVRQLRHLVDQALTGLREGTR